jgi:dihydrolipoamide dehydrogenase
MSESSYDIVVIGAGPAGYTAAIRAAQRGLRTAVVERQELGGVCLNRGCIPSKAMLRSAEVLGLLRSAEEFGLTAEGVGGDYGAVVERRDHVVAHLVQGVTNLLRSNAITVLRGAAQLQDPHQLTVTGSEGAESISFQHLILATGSSSATPPIPGVDLPGVVDSDGALALREAPGQAVVIGGGAVGVEWAEIWNAFGTQVTVVEMLPQIIPTEENELARELNRAFGKKGIQCHTGARVAAIRQGAERLEVVAEINGAESVFPADVVLLAVGRRPNVDGLGLDAAGVQLDGRRIPVDPYLRTNVPHIYAVGDVTGRFQLAHVGSHQGIIAAETIAGRPHRPFDERIVPAAIFTHPEVASVGLREREAKEQGIAVKIGRFPFAASGRALTQGEGGGFVKMVAEAESGRLLGVHIIGTGAGELIAEATLALTLNATVEDLADAIHIHPTLSEAVMEAAMVTAGTPVHVPLRVRAASSSAGG